MHLAQALAKYAFGLGTLTMAASTVIFTLFALPPGHGIGTQILVKVCLIPLLSPANTGTQPTCIWQQHIAQLTRCGKTCEGHPVLAACWLLKQVTANGD